jgi:hypothetical protein
MEGHGGDPPPIAPDAKRLWFSDPVLPYSAGKKRVTGGAWQEKIDKMIAKRGKT